MKDEKGCWELKVKGLVQGVGFRPFIYRMATTNKLTGWVKNTNESVLITVEGKKDDYRSFRESLEKKHPDAASIRLIEEKQIPARSFKDFKILNSKNLSGDITQISPDISVCPECLDDMRNQPNRIQYPFINCTNCGPRFSIIKDLPYDRSRTTMAPFALCRKCSSEYHDVNDRRFHAQPVACMECGPAYELNVNGKAVKGMDEILSEVKRILKLSGVIAIKGLGGYQLICDATDIDALKKIRQIKTREKKPFALMMRNIGVVRKYALVDESEEEMLKSWRRPIVLLQQKNEAVPTQDTGNAGFPISSGLHKSSGLPPLKYSLTDPQNVLYAPSGKCEVMTSLNNPGTPFRKHKVLATQKTPGSPLPENTIFASEKWELINQNLGHLGIILPYLPLHYLIFSVIDSDAIVFTSGNLKDEPIITDDKIAMNIFGNQEKSKPDHQENDVERNMVPNIEHGQKISGADGLINQQINAVEGVLFYNREIYNRVDDSVGMVVNKKQRLIRRARGYVPEPIQLPFSVDGLLATGAELVNCFCIGKGDQAIMSQHIGDLKNYETYNFFTSNINQFKKLFRFEPSMILHDLHPDYLSTRYAIESGLPAEGIQHHHAHLAACMAEHRINEPVIGVCFDGTGFGVDGHLWGGEFLYTSYHEFERFAHLQYIPLPGGEKAIKEPWRTGLALLYQTFGNDVWQLDIPFIRQLDGQKGRMLLSAVDKKINCPLSSGAGRIFDAVAAILNLCTYSDYHAQAPMVLESYTDEKVKDGYRLGFDKAIGLNTLFQQITNDMIHGTPVEKMVTKFHNTIISIIFAGIKAMANHYKTNKVVVSGGVFQNRYILENLEKSISRSYDLYTPERIPCNDAGIAIGQLAIGAHIKSGM